MAVIRLLNVNFTRYSSYINNIKIRLSQPIDAGAINKLIYKDFLQNEPIVNSLHLSCNGIIPMFNELLNSPFAKDYSVVCVDENDSTKGTNAVLRCELVAVENGHGGNGICRKMVIEGLPLIVEKIPQIKFSIVETTNKYSLHAFIKAGFTLGSRIYFADHGVKKSENGTELIGGCYKIF
uniref:N-acetyltransferase domain-containing protein n=1 Tax=Rhabditophanes sp. KR3021 TaxID=114890 RepID=A0AC35TNI6_9BILA